MSGVDWTACAGQNARRRLKGFSPSQIGFSSNPMYPLLLSGAVPGFKEKLISSNVANNWNGIQAARQELSWSEVDSRDAWLW